MSRPLDTQIIQGAQALLSSPKRWCQFYDARDCNGWLTDWDAEDAAKFCAWGALARASFDLGLPAEIAGQLASRIASQMTDGAECLESINDSQGRLAVLNLFDAALKG